MLVATLTISLKKITSGVKFAEQKSALLQNNNVWKKKFSVLQGNPAVASPKEQLYEQMTSNPAFTERNIPKPNASLLEFLFFSTELVRMCLARQHFDFNSADCDHQLIFANNGKGIYLSVQGPVSRKSRQLTCP